MQLKFGSFLTTWGASIWSMDFVYAEKNQIERGNLEKLQVFWKLKKKIPFCCRIETIPRPFIIFFYNCLFSCIAPVAQWESICFACQRSRDQTPLWSISYIFSFFAPFWSGVCSNPSKNFNFSTFFNPHPMTLRDPLGVLWRPPGGWGAAESGGNWSKFDF